MSETIFEYAPLTEEEKAVFEAAAPDAVHLYAGRRTATPEQFAQATVILGWPRPNMVAQAAHLKWFHCMWAGTEEYVDVMPAGAALTSSAGTNSQSVSEHLLASLLALYRKLPCAGTARGSTNGIRTSARCALWWAPLSWWPGLAMWAPPSPSCARPWGQNAPSA